MLKSYFKLILACTVLTGCAAPAPSERLTRSLQNYQKKPELIKLPEINKALTVEIGDSLISAYYQYAVPAVEVTEPYGTETSNVGKTFTLSISPGKYIAKGTDSNGIFYESVTGKLNVNNTPVSTITFGVYVENATPTITEVYTLTNDGRPLIYSAQNLKIIKYIDKSVSSTEFKKELVYTGVSKNIVSIMYREFFDGIARPAFTQELKYDIGEGNVFGFKGARFEIIKATNTGLTYRALSHLN